jgi:YaiO family outer membrane protein
MISGSLNYTNRFSEKGMQYELNAYPRLSSKMRAFIGAAYSKDSVFPKYNLGAGLTHTLFTLAELEVGARYLQFTRLPDPILIYTGAVSITYHRIWASVRTYINPRPAGIAQSYYVTGRYYMKNRKNNISLTLNTGLSPHDYLDPITGKIYNYPTKSGRAKFTYQTVFLSQKTLLKLSLAYEKRTYYSGMTRERISTGLGIERLF